MVCDGIIIFGSLDKVCTSIEEEQWREGEREGSSRCNKEGGENLHMLSDVGGCMLPNKSTAKHLDAYIYARCSYLRTSILMHSIRKYTRKALPPRETHTGTSTHTRTQYMDRLTNQSTKAVRSTQSPTQSHVRPNGDLTNRDRHEYVDR